MPDHADLERYRPQIRRFLEITGRGPDSKGKYRCPNPEGHVNGDEHYSGEIMDENRLYCPICNTARDVFSCAELITGKTARRQFPEVVKYVKETLGDFSGEPPRRDPPTKTADEPKGSWVPLSVAEAKIQYTARRLLELALFCKQIIRELGSDLVIAGSWTCKDPEGRVEILAVRFERKGDREKREREELERLDKIVLSFWWDGKSVRFKGAPVRLFGRDLLGRNPDWPVLIVEGEKCWAWATGFRPSGFAAAQAIPGYVAVTWNGGGKKAKLVDWSALAGRDITIYPDDDPPGKETAHFLATVLQPIAQSVRVVEPLPEARALKPQAADIVEALQVRSPQEMAEYLRSGPELLGPDAAMGDEAVHVPGGSNGEGHAHADSLTGSDGKPFRTLGTADDGNTYFLDQFGRLQTWKLETINKDKLRVLAAFSYWYAHYSSGEKLSWDRAIEDVLQDGGSQTFDRAKIRGRGAWTEEV